MVKMLKVDYKNSGLELLLRTFGWTLGFMLIITTPWVINDMISYFSKGFRIFYVKKPGKN